MEISLIGETLKFLVLGMSTVFMFLVLMVLVVELQSKLLIRFFPQKKELMPSMENGKTTISNKHNLAVVAAIAVALKTDKQSKQ